MLCEMKAYVHVWRVSANTTFVYSPSLPVLFFIFFCYQGKKRRGKKTFSHPLMQIAFNDIVMDERPKSNELKNVALSTQKKKQFKRTEAKRERVMAVLSFFLVITLVVNMKKIKKRWNSSVLNFKFFIVYKKQKSSLIVYWRFFKTQRKSFGMLSCLLIIRITYATFQFIRRTDGLESLNQKQPLGQHFLLFSLF